MIVNATSNGWEIIYQRAHGLLAVQFAHHWQRGQLKERWIETLAAITEHDDGQEPLHGHHHLTEVGAPKDFTFQDFSLYQATKVTETAQYKSRWVALLTSMHMSFLYESLRGKSKEISQFLDSQVENQKKWKQELKVTDQYAQEAYNLLQWCDRCSLILCKNQLPEDEKKLEVHDGPDQNNYMIIKRNDNTITVAPWPFTENRFRVWVEARELSQIHFEKDEMLAQALREAPVQIKEWEFRK